MFCIFGFGICGPDAESKQILKKQLVNVEDIFRSVSEKSLSSHRATISNIMSIAAKAEGSVMISGITMQQYAELTSKSVMNLNKSLDMKNIADKIMESSISLTSGAKTDKSGLLVESSKPTLSTAQQDLVTTIKKQITEKYESIDKSECVSSIVNSQMITAESVTGDVTITGINFVQTAKLVSDCMIKMFKDILLDIRVEEKLMETLASETFAQKKTTGLGVGLMQGIGSMISGFNLWMIVLTIGGIIIAISVIVGIILLIRWIFVRKTQETKRLIRRFRGKNAYQQV
jgi:hypothetical protein